MAPTDEIVGTPRRTPRASTVENDPRGATKEIRRLSSLIEISQALAATLNTGRGGFVYTGSLHQVWVQLLGLAAVGAFTFSASFAVLWTFDKTIGIRTEPEVETAGLDVSEHGMWGYPEFYIPVPGGYGTESHGHLLGQAHQPRPQVPPQSVEEAA